MGVIRRIACATSSVALMLAAAAPVARSAGFELTAQARSVSVTITNRTLNCPPIGNCSVLTTTTQSDSATAPDFSPFSATAMSPPYTQSTATQTSSLAGSAIAATGSTRAFSSAVLITAPNLYASSEASASNSFSASFDVDTLTPYQLGGMVRATGGFFLANTTVRATLKTSGAR